MRILVSFLSGIRNGCIIRAICLQCDLAVCYRHRTEDNADDARWLRCAVRARWKSQKKRRQI